MSPIVALCRSDLATLPCFSVVGNRSAFHLCFVFHSSNGRLFLLLWKWNPRGGQPGLYLKFVPVYWRSLQIQGLRRGERFAGQSAWHCKNSQFCRCFRPFGHGIACRSRRYFRPCSKSFRGNNIVITRWGRHWRMFVSCAVLA